jgi:hypothetical protein
MRRAVILGSFVASLVAMASAARADETFEARAAGAIRIQRLDDLVWALTATCEGGDDVQQRQCRRVRDTRAAELAGATLLVDGDREAFSVGAWSPQKKSVPLQLRACIRCSGLELDGKTWFVVANTDGAPPRFEGGKLRVGPLHDNSRPLPDEGAAKKLAQTAETAKVQMLVKVPAKATWNTDGRLGIALDLVAYRIVSPCDGSVLLASAPSAPGEVDRIACVGGAREMDELTQAVIKESIKPVLAAARACHAKYKVPGRGKLKLAIASDGTVESTEHEGDFGGTPTGQCIDSAARSLVFPRTKKARTGVAVPIALP